MECVVHRSEYTCQADKSLMNRISASPLLESGGGLNEAPAHKPSDKKLENKALRSVQYESTWNVSTSR